MKILISNDDGVDNPGIWALVRAVKALGEVVVVGPATNQSGVGAGISFRKPVHITEHESRVVGVECYAVAGTPADSVVLGIKHVLDGEVDAVIAGFNPGSNTSRNLLISGTMGAAIVASSNGVKAAAFSVAALEEVGDPVIGKITTAITNELISDQTRQGSLFNVNFPPLNAGKIQGAEGAVPAPSLHQMKLYPDNGGFEIGSRLAVDWDGNELPPGTDAEVLNRGHVSISALDGNTLVHDPEDPSLKRMIVAANSVIG